MTLRPLAALFLSFTLLVSFSCGYRFVHPYPYCACALENVGNATSEPGLDRVLEQAFREEGVFSPQSPDRLFIVVTRFEEVVDTVASGGITVRQKLRMEVSWKVQGEDPSRAVSGEETVAITYPYSGDAAQMDWNRAGAVRLMARDAARKVLEQVENSTL
ncbi:MAG: hypothetical protein JXR72_04490 [Proteobacteria bacterium]|nr:hypothetical protein [Pseudomonadota bacterium]